jgi:glycosyltransferase involved in cell wall biosynthesis
MKIACISTSQVPSTTANSIQVMKVCQVMQILGHQVKLWTPGKKDNSFSDIADLYGLHEHFELEWVPSWNRLKRYDFAWIAISRAIAWSADLIYTWTPQAALFASWKNRGSVLEMHDRVTGKFGPGILRQYLSEARTDFELVCVTHALRLALEKQLTVSIPDDRVVIAPNGVDEERYQNLPDAERARELLGLVQWPTVSYTGHFYAGRGIDVLFDLAAKFPQVQFLWIGGREKELADIRARLQREDLSNVILTGFVDNQKLPLYQAASDVLLMPYERSIAGSSGGNSADICSPMKMFEYMAAGRAIITSDLPVIHEVLNEETAYFCPPEDTKAWENCLAEILANPGHANWKGMAARSILQGYTIQNRQIAILKKFTD